MIFILNVKNIYIIEGSCDMLLDENVNPKYDVYYLASRILEVLVSNENESISQPEFLHAVRNKISISATLFFLSLDWLYLLGIIDHTENGGIKKCF